jgi:hypothetical protein
VRLPHKREMRRNSVIRSLGSVMAHRTSPRPVGNGLKLEVRSAVQLLPASCSSGPFDSRSMAMRLGADAKGYTP